MKKKLLSVMGFVLALMLVTVLTLSSALAETTLEKIKKSGKLVVGTEATYGPYEFLDDNAQPVGCDIWLAEKIAAALGVTLEVKDMAFDGIIPAVKSGDIHIGIAAFTVTAERAEVIDFSHQYEVSEQLLIVKKGNADVYATKESLVGKKVGAQLGTIQSQLIEKVLTESELFELDTYPNLAMETVNGNIAGFVCDAAVGLGYVAQNDQLEVSNYVFTSEEAAFGKACVVAKGNEDFMAIVNEVVDKVVEDGSYLEAFETYNAIWKSGADDAE